MTALGRWIRNLVILMMPVIAGCIGPPAVDQRDIGSADSALEADDLGCVSAMFAHYMECSALECPEADVPGRPGGPAVPLPRPGAMVCEGCREEAATAYEECHGTELPGPEALPFRATVPQWGLPDYRIEVHAAPTPDECVNCGWMRR